MVYRTALSFDPCTTEHGGHSIILDLNVSICTYCVLSDKNDLNIVNSAPCIPYNYNLSSSLVLSIVSNAADRSVATVAVM